MSSDTILLLKLTICGQTSALGLSKTFRFIAIYNPIPFNVYKSIVFLFFFNFDTWTWSFPIGGNICVNIRLSLCVSHLRDFLSRVYPASPNLSTLTPHRSGKENVEKEEETWPLVSIQHFQHNCVQNV